MWDRLVGVGPEGPHTVGEEESPGGPRKESPRKENFPRGSRKHKSSSGA